MTRPQGSAAPAAAVLLASLVAAAGCGGGGGGGGACDLVAGGGLAARLQVTNALGHTAGWSVAGAPDFSQLSDGECTRMGVAAGAYTVHATSCANSACNSPHLAERDVSGTIAAGETIEYVLDDAFFAP